MSDPKSLSAAAETLASNPKVASTIAVGATSMGYAGTMEMLHGIIGLTSMIIGCIVGLFVIRVHYLKGKQLQRALDASDFEGGDE